MPHQRLVTVAFQRYKKPVKMQGSEQGRLLRKKECQSATVFQVLEPGVNRLRYPVLEQGPRKSVALSRER